jgi:C4-dicarboxylate transporter, DctM subunit
VIIPPSIPMILYAVMADASVVQIFVAGIIPGILGGGGMMALAYWYARRYNYPVEEVFSWPPVDHLQGRGLGLPAAADHPRRHLRRLRHRHRGRGAGGAGGAVHRRRDLPRARLRTSTRRCSTAAMQTAVVMLLVAASALLGVFLTEQQVPQQLAGWISA